MTENRGTLPTQREEPLCDVFMNDDRRSYRRANAICCYNRHHTRVLSMDMQHHGQQRVQLGLDIVALRAAALADYRDR